jgi:hypothetical protein
MPSPGSRVIRKLEVMAAQVLGARLRVDVWVH